MFQSCIDLFDFFTLNRYNSLTINFANDGIIRYHEDRFTSAESLAFSTLKPPKVDFPWRWWASSAQVTTPWSVWPLRLPLLSARLWSKREISHFWTEKVQKLHFAINETRKHTFSVKNREGVLPIIQSLAHCFKSREQADEYLKQCAND